LLHHLSNQVPSKGKHEAEVGFGGLQGDPNGGVAGTTREAVPQWLMGHGQLKGARGSGDTRVSADDDLAKLRRCLEVR
jgi:hypothetical protein